MSFFALKTLAVFSMLFDHIYHLFHEELLDQSLSQLADWASTQFPGLVGQALGLICRFLILALPYLGRIAAPVFLFCTANGYRHTHNVKGYLRRIFLFGALAQIPYFLYFRALYAKTGEAYAIPWNFMFTLGLGLLSIHLYETFRKQGDFSSWIAALLPVLAASLLGTEGGGMYALVALAFHLSIDLPAPRRTVLWFCFFPLARMDLWIWLFMGPLTLQRISTALLGGLGPCLGILPLLWYNGEKGQASRLTQYGVYALYPLHFLVLALLGFAFS